MDLNVMRNVLLEVVSDYGLQGPGMLQPKSVLAEVRRRLKITSIDHEQALLVFWNDLFRSGQLAWGYNLSNPEPPFCHITARGRKTLEHFSRDPINKEGYLAYLQAAGSVNDITLSYITEALDTYVGNHYKATAVLVGGAAESIILEIRDALVAKITASGAKPHQDLQGWQIKKILDGITRAIEQHKSIIPKVLMERFDSYWPALVTQIRHVRNDVGHPTSVNPVTPEMVHGSLLIFPELVGLAAQLMAWIQTQYP